MATSCRAWATPATACTGRSSRATQRVGWVPALRGFADFERSTIAQFGVVDVVVTPALAMAPRPIGWYSDDPERNFEQQVQFTPFTSFVNVAGLPAIAVPITESDGLPVAVHLIGRPGGEATLVALAAQLEASFSWADRHPPVWFD